jgi:hypothetical protein
LWPILWHTPSPVPQSGCLGRRHDRFLSVDTAQVASDDETRRSDCMRVADDGVRSNGTCSTVRSKRRPGSEIAT